MWDNADDSAFDMGAWAPAEHEYGLFTLLLCRSAMADDGGSSAPPEEVANLKFVDSRALSQAAAPARRDPFSSDDDASSDGDPRGSTEASSWPGKEGSWWRVNSQLQEDLIVREGVSITTEELRRIPPGELLQQASGHARTLTGGRKKGCIRIPVQPNGWVTADASKAGGPKYLIRASAPRWRVVYSANKPDQPDAVVREDPTLDSETVAMLHNGDVVEQAGPSLTRSDGIVRMPVTANVVRRGEAENGETLTNGRNGNKPAKTLGWVTVDATAAGGPVFFKPAADVDKDKRRRRPKPQQWN